ncbi:hypothetical protein [Blastopirellula marina]|uniref:HEAT repeat domain-containing protein n=1 Tax=Blastopirellula marina TaxID=124 RepID=A0A2S8GK82_9BACT|nr:hypothetical protein [Blastopirellula marina]PQO44842.1 hypothetical protein C5Y93_17260 [Blastopirellula marina]
MSDSEASSGKVRTWQVPLSTLFMFVLMFGLVLAWWTERSRIQRELDDLRLETEIQSRLISQATPRDNFPLGPRYFREPVREGTTDSFIQAIEQGNARSILQMDLSLSSAEDSVFKPIMERLVPLLELGPEAEGVAPQSCTLQVLKEQQIYSRNPARMKPYQADITEKILAILNSLEQQQHNPRTVSDAFEVLRKFGPNSSAEAIQAMTDMMEDDQHPWAVKAAFSVQAMDPKLSIGPRLMELIEVRHPDWQAAAMDLSEYVPAQQAKDFLKAQYAEASPADQQIIIQAIGKIRL